MPRNKLLREALSMLPDGCKAGTKLSVLFGDGKEEETSRRELPKLVRKVGFRRGGIEEIQIALNDAD